MLSYEEAPRDLRRRLPGDRRRDPRAGRIEARRPADARPRAAADPRAGPAPRRPLGDRRGPAGARRLPRRGRAGAARRPRPRARHRASSRPRSRRPGPARPRRYAAPRGDGPDPRREDHARLHQHPRPGRALLPGALGRERRGPADRAAPRLAQPRGAQPGRGGDGRRARCAPSSPPARSTSASTGATSTSWSRSARRRTSSGWCSASAAPTTATTPRRAPCWCRRTASRCSNAAPRSTRSRAHDLDGEPRGPGPLDVLCQHILLDRLRRPVRRRRALRRGPHAPAPTAASPRADFDACLEFCATGGYALARLRPLAAAGLSGRPLAAARPAPGAGDPDERRHHRRHREARRCGSRGRGARRSARSRRTSPPPWPPATPS